jgi:hypothetical protein
MVGSPANLMIQTSPRIKALVEVRHLAPRGATVNVQAIIVAIDQYAEAALGNRDFE